MRNQTRVAALQLAAEVGNIDANLQMCAELTTRAVRDGAEWVVLPEFFSTGVANRPDLAQNAPPPDGAPTVLLQDLARTHGIHTAGSTLVRDADGHVRNAYFLVGPDGVIKGRHDKDLPTAWESALYIGGTDAGRISLGDKTIGIAMCWELMRTQTAARLAGQVDLVLGGSGWWSIPTLPPRPLTRWLERRNNIRAVNAPSVFAAYCGAPMVHAAHSGAVSCPLPLAGMVYGGHFAGGASVTAADGTVLAVRRRPEGPGFAIANITPGRQQPRPLPDRFWLQQRGAVATLAWAYQNPWGRAQYRRSHGQQPFSRASG
ncbi:carbon-nitrogen hydrolase family protein [Nocardia sp. NPDC050712]|uniref:carbon-nitrogen hydrolase family protein n=1 Tax=Nocardia sp. NPDC050712 TaxID=3155518 RepID=UPI0033C9236A